MASAYLDVKQGARKMFKISPSEMNGDHSHNYMYLRRRKMGCFFKSVLDFAKISIPTL